MAARVPRAGCGPTLACAAAPTQAIAHPAQRPAHTPRRISRRESLQRAGVCYCSMDDLHVRWRHWDASLSAPAEPASPCAQGYALRARADRAESADAPMGFPPNARVSRMWPCLHTSARSSSRRRACHPEPLQHHLGATGMEKARRRARLGLNTGSGAGVHL